MKRTWIVSWMAPFALAFAVGCEQTGEVDREIGDLQEAREQTGARVQELREELAGAKQRVVELEKELVLAERGLTEDVVQEREELREALAEKQERVSGKVQDAQREAKQLDQQSDTAREHLDDVQGVERVDAEIETKTKVIPKEREVETIRKTEQITVEETQAPPIEDIEETTETSTTEIE